MYLTRRNKQHWLRQETTTLTMQDIYPNGWTDMLELSQWDETTENIAEYEKIFNTLYALYGAEAEFNKNTEQIITPWLVMIIQEEYEKFSKANELWEMQIEKLIGAFTEGNIFNIGDIKEAGEDFDKYKSGRQTTVAATNLKRHIKELQDMMTPFERLIERIAKKVFKPINVEDRYVEVEL